MIHICICSVFKIVVCDLLVFLQHLSHFSADTNDNLSQNFRYLAMVMYHAGDMSGAISQQHKELIINERCLGLDHPDTAHRQ